MTTALSGRVQVKGAHERFEGTRVSDGSEAAVWLVETYVILGAHVQDDAVPSALPQFPWQGLESIEQLGTLRGHGTAVGEGDGAETIELTPQGNPWAGRAARGPGAGEHQPVHDKECNVWFTRCKRLCLSGAGCCFTQVSFSAQPALPNG